MADALKLVWIDLEMTGLNPDSDVVLEIACIITGADLKPVAEYHAVIFQPEEALERMSPFVRNMHTQNGLINRVRASRTELKQAEADTLALVAKHCKPGEGVLAGNSIHQDRRFMVRYMPALEGYLHYRQVDVSTLKVLTRAWYPDSPKFEKPVKDHTALADIKESIAELKYYRERILRPNSALIDAKKLVELSDGDVRLWVEQSSSVMLKAQTKVHADPVELNEAEVESLIQALLAMLVELRSN